MILPSFLPSLFKLTVEEQEGKNFPLSLSLLDDSILLLTLKGNQSLN